MAARMDLTASRSVVPISNLSCLLAGNGRRLRPFLGVTRFFGDEIYRSAIPLISTWHLGSISPVTPIKVIAGKCLPKISWKA